MIRRLRNLLLLVLLGGLLLVLWSAVSIYTYSPPTRTIRWINAYTKSRAFVQEVVSYIVYLFGG